MASSKNLNPMSGLYRQFMDILDNLTIKYTYTAAEYDTLESKKEADRYLDAINKRDNFYTYSNFTEFEVKSIGIVDYNIISEVNKGNMDAIPIMYRNQLVENRRNKIIKEYEEQNEYYRVYNGLPPLGTYNTHLCYLPEEYANWIGLPEEERHIPVHKIQDYFNNKEKGLGDYYINMLEGTNYINELIEANPDKIYLRYIGSNRISINSLRTAKNFEVIQLKGAKLSTVMFDTFLQVYEQCREYVVKVLYNSFYREIIPYYDNFMGLIIMVMTINNMVMKQIPLGVRREFYNKAGMQALYEAYNIPYNLMLDEETQSNIVQNLNLMIQHKATDKVIYDIANLLGFSSIDVFKYYLVREQKFDRYGVPIVEWAERFNNDTGEFEIHPDYEAMYNRYFQKAELRNQNFQEALTHPENKVDYDFITTNDPFWLEDTNLVKTVYETRYNFVESKYLSLSISYSMTDIIFDNTILLKLLLHNKNTLNTITVPIPKITNSVGGIPIFDVVTLLLCLTAAKHELCGEIITTPSQVIAVMDYNQNLQDSELLVDTLAFDFRLFHPSNKEGQEHLEKLKSVLSEEDYAEFVSYLSNLNIDDKLPNSQKIEMINNAYKDIRKLYNFLEYHMSKTQDHYTYEVLKRLYRAAFYSQEMADIFVITGKYTGIERTAKNYFEYLYYSNPKLYNCIFEVDFEARYREYVESIGKTVRDYSFDEFMVEVELGNIDVDYSNMKDIEIDDTDAKDEKIYFYVNHVIDRIGRVIKDINYLNLLLEMGSPLEDLLLKLVRFFKSFTVDILGLDHQYICDFKNENFLKLIDKIDYILKIDEVHEDLKLNHSDVLNRIVVNIDLLEKCKFNDKAMYESWLTIMNDFGRRNGIKFSSSVPKISKELSINDSLGYYDANFITSNLQISDRVSFKDKVFISYDE